MKFKPLLLLSTVLFASYACKSMEIAINNIDDYELPTYNFPEKRIQLSPAAFTELQNFSLQKLQKREPIQRKYDSETTALIAKNNENKELHKQIALANQQKQELKNKKQELDKKEEELKEQEKILTQKKEENIRKQNLFLARLLKDQVEKDIKQHNIRKQNQSNRSTPLNKADSKEIQHLKEITIQQLERASEEEKQRVQKFIQQRAQQTPQQIAIKQKMDVLKILYSKYGVQNPKDLKDILYDYCMDRDLDYLRHRISKSYSFEYYPDTNELEIFTDDYSSEELSSDYSSNDSSNACSSDESTD